MENDVMASMIRLDRFLSEMGVGSRSDVKKQAILQAPMTDVSTYLVNRDFEGDFLKQGDTVSIVKPDPKSVKFQFGRLKDGKVLAGNVGTKGSTDGAAKDERLKCTVAQFEKNTLTIDDEGNLNHNILMYGQEFLGHSSNANFGNNSTYFEANLSYNTSINELHDIDALLLYNQRSYDWGDIQPKRTQGIAGRLSYTYDRRYVGEFNFG